MLEALPLASLAMLCSASLHAFMGLLTKQAGDRLVFRATMMSIGAVYVLPILLSNPVPDWSVWRFLLLGAVLHWAFQMAMIRAFEHGDMGLVYPIMRGGAPLLAGLVAFLVLGEVLSIWEIAGLVVASLAVLGFGWPEKGGRPKVQAIGFAFLAAGMTALYSVNDASGARAASSPFVYLAWFAVVTAIPILLTALIRRGRDLPGLMRPELKSGAIASIFGLASYGFALFAYANAAVGPMSALRETSVVIGAILAAVVLKEGFGKRRIALSVVLVGGLIAMRLAAA